MEQKYKRQYRQLSDDVIQKISQSTAKNQNPLNIGHI